MHENKTNPEHNVPDKKNDTAKRTQRTLIIVLLAIIVILLLLRSCGQSGTYNPAATPTPTGSVEIDPNRRPAAEKVEVADDIENITFAGFGKVEISKDRPQVELRNPDNNKCSFIFTLIDEDSGDVIATTSVVNPTEYAYVDVYEYYQTAGTYKVAVKIETLSADGQEMSGMTQHMEVVVLAK